MEINTKYKKYNDLRFCKADQCWVREMLMDDVWFCFYSKEEDRLKDDKIQAYMQRLKEMNFAESIKQRSDCVVKEFQGYVHVLWEDFLPQSAGFISLKYMPVFWDTLLMLPTPENPPPATPIQYTLVK